MTKRERARNPPGGPAGAPADPGAGPNRRGLGATPDRAVAVPAGEPRSPARQGSLSRPRQFPAGQGASVRRAAAEPRPERMSLEGEGAVLEKGIVYVAPLIERLALAGRRLRRRQSEKLDRPARHFHPPDRRRLRRVRRRAGRLSWAALGWRFRRAAFQRARARGHAAQPVAPARRRGAARARRRGSARPARGLAAGRRRRSRCATGSSSMSGSPASLAKSSATARSRTATSSTSTGRRLSRRRISGSRFARATDRRLILDPEDFYILASREKMQIPADLAAEMAPIDPAIGEFRVHYAGFFDPGFGQGADGRPARPRGARGALPRRAVPARGRPAGRPARVRGAGRRHGRALRRRRDVELPAPGAEAVEAFSRIEQALTLARHPRLTSLSQAGASRA